MLVRIDSEHMVQHLSYESLMKLETLVTRRIRDLKEDAWEYARDNPDVPVESSKDRVQAVQVLRSFHPGWSLSYCMDVVKLAAEYRGSPALCPRPETSA